MTRRKTPVAAERGPALSGEFAALVRIVGAERWVLRHPLEEEELPLRFAYAFAVNAAARDQGAQEEAEARLEGFLRGLTIPEAMEARLKSDLAGRLTKQLVRTIVGALTSRFSQFLLLLEMRVVCGGPKGAEPSLAPIEEVFAQVFRWPAELRQAWTAAVQAIASRNRRALAKAFEALPDCGAARQNAAVAYFLSEETEKRSRELAEEIEKATTALAAEQTKRKPRPKAQYYRNGRRVSKQKYEEELERRRPSVRLTVTDVEGAAWDKRNKAPIAKLEQRQHCPVRLLQERRAQDLRACAPDRMNLSREVGFRCGFCVGAL